MTYDVVIVGNGILGLSTAFSLSLLDPTLKIAIVAPSHREGSASVAAGAMLNAFAELTSTSLKSKAGEEKFENALKASKQWDSWIQSINDFLPEAEKLTIQDGTFVILNAKSGILDSENFNTILNVLKQRQEPYEEVDPQSIPGLNPVEDCRPLRSLYLPKEGCINSGRVINALEDILQKHCNVTFIHQKALSFNVAGHAVVSLNTDQGEIISARNFVIAAGSYSQKLIDTLPQISRNIPRLLSGMGCSVIVSQDPKHTVHHVIRTPNRSGACGLHVTPQGQELYIGATNNIYEEPRSNHKIGFTHFLLECALEQINQNLHSADLKTCHTGNRPATLDTFPLLGQTSIEGLWIMTGTYRDGFHQSPVLSESIARAILGLPNDLSPTFKPERSLIRTFTKEESIEEAIKHYMCGAYERSMKLPKAGWDEVLREMIFNRLHYIYDQLETDFGLTPDLFMMFEFAPHFEETLDRFKSYLNGTFIQKKIRAL